MVFQTNVFASYVEDIFSKTYSFLQCPIGIHDTVCKLKSVQWSRYWPHPSVYISFKLNELFVIL